MKKVILVTGASSGIGQATANLLVKEGHIVYGSCRNKESAQALKKLNIIPIEMEMTDDGSLKKGINKIIKAQKRIDVLFNNAGYGLYGTIEDIPLGDARHQLEVNLYAPARLIQLVLPHMRKAKSGLIINTSSMGGKIYTPLGGWYHASKHAIEGLSDCLRLELDQFNIKVVVIEPGIIMTPWGQVAAGHIMKYSKKSAYKKFIDKVVKGTTAAYEQGMASKPEVIAEVVLKAINADKPKTRYVAGKYARQMLFIRKYFGDKTYDRMITSRLK